MDAAPLTQQQYSYLFQHISRGFALVEKIKLPEEAGSNYSLLVVNPAFEKQAKLWGKEQGTLLELLPETGKAVIGHCDTVVETGSSLVFDQNVPEWDRWIACEVFPTGVYGQIGLLCDDITDRKQIESALTLRELTEEAVHEAAEERIRMMEAEKQVEIVRVSMTTLEEERHRISENLHNGIGQILYGIKISLSGLKREMESDEYDSTKTFTDKLLTDAILETRRISHELMPATLEEFGLKNAIDDICQQMHNGVNFTCRVTGLKQRLEKYLELAVYRTVQELMTNIIKHAKATLGLVDVIVGPKEIFIKVSDNGQGIQAKRQSRPGIGLASIRSKIKLMNGRVEIHSVENEGTTVQVTIPMPNLT